MTDYENMSLEELQKEKESRDKAKLTAEFAEQDRVKAEKEAKDYKNEVREQIKEELLKENPPEEKIPPISIEKPNTTGEVSPTQAYYDSYVKRHSEFETKSQYVNKREDIDKARFQIYEDQQWKECSINGLWGNTSSDSGCDDVVSDWSPADTYAKAVWETFVCTADLLRVCVKGISINPGDGLGVQIRAFGAFGTPSSLGACECASCASITWTTYPLTLKQYNLEAIVCDKDMWDVGTLMMDKYLISMANSWAQWFDAQIYSELETATPGTSQQLPADLNCTPGLTGSCCTDLSLLNLYNAINTLVATMREATAPKNPDYLIISPTVASIFKRMQNPTPMPWMGGVTFDDDGRMKKFGGLKVIEYCGANSCTDLADEPVAIVIDSRRAVGCVFGQRPKTYKEFQSNCNSYRIDQWAYVAFGELDTGSIGHVINAS